MFRRAFSKPPEQTPTHALNKDINRYILTSHDNKRMIYNLMYTFTQGREDEAFLKSCTTKSKFAEQYANKEQVNIGIVVKLSDICYMVDRFIITNNKYEYIWLFLDTNQRDEKDFNSLALITSVSENAYEERGIKIMDHIEYTFSELNKLFYNLDKNSIGRSIFSKQALANANDIIEKWYPKYDHTKQAMSAENCTRKRTQ